VSQGQRDNQWFLVDYQPLIDNRTMALTRFSLRQIEAFISVYEAQSFTMAASRLGLTAQRPANWFLNLNPSWASGCLTAQHESRLIKRRTGLWLRLQRCYAM
jgi:hypothetical protein